MDKNDREYISSEESEVDPCCYPINEEAELLCEVAERGDKATIECLLEAAVAVNLRNEDNKTPLHLAAAANNIETAQVLLQNNAKINASFLDDFLDKQTPLLEAIHSGHSEMVQMLLEHGAESSSYSLMKAAEFGKSEIVQLLLKHRANLNSEKALHKAVVSGNIDTVKLLLDHGASVSVTARDSENALHKAASSGKKDVVEILIKHGANINAVSCEDVTALHKAADSGHLDIAQLLIQNGASIDAKSKNGVTALHKSVRSGNEELVKMLIEEGADVNSADLRGAVPIIIAVSEKQNSIARLLLRSGANVNTADANGNSVLHQAILSGSKELVLQLLKENASLNTVDCHGRSHLQLAVSLGDLDIAQLLVEWGANPNAIDSEGSPILHQAIEHGQEQTVIALLNHGACVNACNFNGITALHLAMYKYGDFITHVLLDYEANPNTVDQDGKSALNKAVNLENVDLVVSLLEHGADVNYYDRKGTAPLLYAAEQDNEEIVKVLIHYGAIVNARNRYDRVPLHLTSSWTIVKLLLENKAWANAKELYNEETPLLTRAKNISRSTYDFYHQSSIDDGSDLQWKEILKSGMSPWAANNVGETVLGTLLSKNKLELSLSLLKSMHESNRSCFNNLHTNGETLLHVACRHEGQEVIDYLLKNRAKVNIQNRKKETPLHVTCRKVNETFHGNDKDSLTLDKREQSLSETVYYWTARQLLAYGADPSVFKDNQGLSCLDLARGNNELLDLLKRPVDLMEVPQLLKWSSKSDNHCQKVGQIARGQRSLQVATFHYHIDPIGNGAFGHVYAGLDERDGREVAVKRLLKGCLDRRQDDREIRNLVELKDSAYVVKYLSCTSDEYFSYIILELMEGTLLEYMKIRTSDEQSISMCKDIVMGLNYLHENNVLHRDIKPSNILYKTNPKLSLKIADFGLSIKTDIASSCKTTVLHSNAGTPCWMAPELLKAPGKIKHVEKTDVFACGLVLHFILAEQVHPFAPLDIKDRNKVDCDNATQRNIMTHTLTLHKTLSAEAKHLIKEMLEEELEKRPKTASVLQHPLFWSPKKKVSFICAVGNQVELLVPRHLVTAPSQVEKYLEEWFGKAFDEAPWDLEIPYLFTEMTASGHRRYATSSAVDLIRFIRNSYAHVSDVKRTKPIKKLLLEDFVFFDTFPDLLMVIYETVVCEGWHSTREEIKYCLELETK